MAAGRSRVKRRKLTAEGHVHVSRQHEPPGYLIIEFTPDEGRVEVAVESRWAADPDEHYMARGYITERRLDKFVAHLEELIGEPYTDPTMSGSETSVAYHFPLEGGALTGASSTMLAGPPPHIIVGDVLTFVAALVKSAGFSVIQPVDPELDRDDLEALAVQNPSVAQRVLPWLVLALGGLVAVATVVFVMVMTAR